MEGGFGAAVDYTLSLQANIPVLVDLVGYNGPGNWVFSLREQGTNQLLDNLPGVQISANGRFATTPVPSSLVMSAILLGVFAAVWSYKLWWHSPRGAVPDFLPKAGKLLT